MNPVVIHDRQRLKQATRSIERRQWKNRLFIGVCLGVASLSVIILAVLLGAVVWQGLKFLDGDFLMAPPNPDPAKAGLMPALWGTVWVCLTCAVCTLPLGVATAVFLEEFQPKQRLLRKAHSFLQLNIANLAGVPSVVYGIIGLTAFAYMFGLFGHPQDPAIEWGISYYDQYLTEGDTVILVPAAGPAAPTPPLKPGMAAQTAGGQTIRLNVLGPQDPLPDDSAVLRRTVRHNAEGGRISKSRWYYVRLPFGRGILAGALTLMLVILPILIIASQESLRAVPDSLREAALGMGATRWQVVRKVTLPAAIPGIMTGSIIAMSRAIGEAAPLLMIAGIVFIASTPEHLMDDFTALPLQIYNWAQRPQQPFHEVAASGIIVLLAVLLVFNGLAVFIRQKLQKPLS